MMSDPRVATFLRGLVIGALVGAAIAGSAIWRRTGARRRDHKKWTRAVRRGGGFSDARGSTDVAREHDR
jgi:transposase